MSEYHQSALLDANQYRVVSAPSLRDRFLVPPFTVLDTRQGYWQKRRSEWLALGMQSEQGRSNALQEGLRRMEENENYPNILASNGASVFDPVLCEVIYRWFTPHARAHILDPFAGGVVRGAVACILGYQYTGIELRGEQIDANRRQSHLWQGSDHTPSWLQGDARKELPEHAGHQYDLLFTCPPYADLERYSDDPADLSTLHPDEFLERHTEVVQHAAATLADNRFAVWVVGEVRHSRKRGGPYLNFVGATIDAFTDAGMHYYNEVVLLNSVGSVGIRVNTMFPGNRKLGRVHQTVLVFYKGDLARIQEHHGRLTEHDIPSLEFLGA